MNPIHAIYYSLILIFLTGCAPSKKKSLTAEYIFRNQGEYFYTPAAPYLCETEAYPWEKHSIGGHPHVTKDFFRCNCGSHSLPLRDGKEFVYPCLLDLLNFVQEKTKKKVIITCGHRCRSYNTLADPSSYNWSSKHMLAAEVDFYLKGYDPNKIIELLQEYYKGEPFERFNSDKLDISTPAWFNKEIFIKLYLPGEGRDLDNTHPYPYISIQVRYDQDLKKRVVFDQEQVENYHRN